MSIHAAFHEPATRIYRLVQGVVWALILTSIAALGLQSLLPADSRLVDILGIADHVFLGLFAIEYAARVLTYRPAALAVFHAGPFVRLRTHVIARLRYALSPMLLVDLLAVLAFYPELRGLRALRLLRLLRTAKVFRYSNPFLLIVRTLEENRLLFVFGFTVLVVETIVGGVSIYLLEVAANDKIDSVGDGIWWALVTVTTVGFGDISPETNLGRVVAGFLMIGGMFTLALFAGFVGTSLVSAMLSIREEQFRMGDYANHVVVCGYDASCELLLEQVREEIDTEEERVVVFEDHERPPDVPPDFQWVQGDPTKQSELDKIRLTHAKAVIVVGSREMRGQDADARTILIIFTIRAYLREHQDALEGRRSPVYLIAEILDGENIGHAKSAGADEVVETRRMSFSMLAHAVRYHGSAAAMSRVLTSGFYNAYVGIVPGLESPVPYGELLQEMQLTKQGGLIIGLLPPGQEEIFNPTKQLVVTPGTHVVYLSEKPILEAPN